MIKSGFNTVMSWVKSNKIPNFGMEQRSLVMFQNSQKSIHTAKQYLYYLNRFKDYYHLKDFDSLLGMEPSKLQIMIEDWIIELKKQVNPNTIPPMVFGVKSFFEANDVELKWKKIQRLMPDKIKASGIRAYSKDQIKIMIDTAKDIRAKALILFLASSGIRIGAIPDLRLKHLADYEGCKLVTVYEGTKEEYQTFISPEATKALTVYHNKRIQDGEYFTENTPLFRKVYRLKSEKPKPVNKPTLQEIIRRVLINAGLRQGKKGNRYDVQIDNGFRKFFNSAIKNTEGINLSYAEKLLGHSITIPLDNHYLEPETAKIFKVYSSALTNLTIDESELQAAKLKAKEEKITQLEAKTKENSELQIQINELKQGLQNVINLMVKQSGPLNTAYELQKLVVNHIQESRKE